MVWVVVCFDGVVCAVVVAEPQNVAEATCALAAKTMACIASCTSLNAFSALGSVDLFGCMMRAMFL